MHETTTLQGYEREIRGIQKNIATPQSTGLDEETE